MKLLAKISVALLLLSSSLFAQNEPNISINFTGISFDRGIKDLAMLVNGKKKSVDFLNGTRSNLYRYSGPQTIQFVKRDDESLTPVGSVRIDRSGETYLLIAFHDKTSDTYRFLHFQDDLDSFQLGTTRIVNLSNYDAAVKFGTEKVFVPKRNFKQMSPNYENGKYYPSQVVSLPPDEDPIRVYAGQFQYFENLRLLIILHTPPNGYEGEIDLKTLVGGEFIEDKDDEA